jgi:surface polysaccharide O-acyltransferase-like enzyme
MPRSPQPRPTVAPRDPASAPAPDTDAVSEGVPQVHAHDSTRPVRILQYDIVRVLAVLAVVLIHVTATAIGDAYGSVGRAPLWLLRPNQFMRWSVPAFALLTGSLIWTRHIPLTAASLVSFFRRRFLVVVVPYVLWAALYFVLGRYMGRGPSAVLPAGLLPRLRVAFDLLVQGRVWYHLYFVPVVLMLYLVAPLVAPLARRRPAVLFVLAVAASLVLTDPVGQALAAHANVRALLLLLLGYAPFAAAGAWYAVRRERLDPLLRWAWPLVLGAGSVLRFAEVNGRVDLAAPLAARSFMIAETLLTVFGLMGLAVLVSPLLMGRARLLADLSAWSYGVYLMHPLLITGLESAVFALGLSRLWASPPFVYVVVPAVTAVGFGVSALLHRRRLTAWLV